MTPVCVLPVTLSSDMPLRRLRISRIASPTPTSVPDPPKMLTPPSSTIVMASNSKPSAMLPRTAPNRAASSSPASADTNPDATKSRNLTRTTFTPE